MSDFNKNRKVLRHHTKNPKNESSRKSLRRESRCWIRTEGRTDWRTDLAKLVVDFRSCFSLCAATKNMTWLDVSNNTRNFEPSEERILMKMVLWPRYCILASSEFIGWRNSTMVPICICCRKFHCGGQVSFVKWTHWYIMHCCWSWREFETILVRFFWRIVFRDPRLIRVTYLHKPALPN